MKRLSIWFALILIVLGLLLSGVKNPTQSSGRPSQSLPQQGDEDPNDYQAYSGQWTGTWTVTNSPTNQRRATDQARNSDQHASTLWKIWEWITGISAQAVTNTITAIATAFLAIFTYQLVWVTRDLHKASQSATEVARLALHTDRPYLLVTSVTAEAFKHVLLGRQEPISRAKVTFQNVGTSPAELIEIVATSWKFGCFPDSDEPKWDKLLGAPLSIEKPVVGVRETVDPLPIQVHWTKDDIELVEGGLKRVALYGYVRYRSGSKEDYCTRFFWWFSPLENPPLRKAYDLELNKRT